MAAIAGITSSPHSATAGDLTPEEERGQQIYLSGKSPSGSTILAVLGNGQTKVPAPLFPCAKCHAEDGKGGEEGGVVSADITWHSLTKPYDLRRSDRRTRPPYDRDALVVRAFSLGIDAGGTRLNQVMPRYEMSRDDAVSLVAYLKVLGETTEPGVTENDITIGLIAPPADDAQHDMAWVTPLLSAYFNKVNAAGGVYGRTIRPKVFALPVQPAETEAALAEFLADQQPLAFVAPYLHGRGLDIMANLEADSIPVVGVRPPPGLHGTRPDRSQFFALPGLNVENQVLAAFAMKILGNQTSRTAIVYADQPDWNTMASDSAAALEANGIETLKQLKVTGDSDAHQTARDLQASRMELAILLMPHDAARPFARALSDIGHPMMILAPGSWAAAFGEARLPENSRLFLSRAAIPTDIEQAALTELQTLSSSLPQQGPELEEVLGVLASASALVEGLRQSGRAVTRNRLSSSVEAFYRFSTGYVRPLTFGPNRHVGTGGAYIVEYDIKTGRPIGSNWISLE